MTVSIQFKRGNKANIPASAPSGMPLWCEDTKELYIGTGGSVKKIGSSSTDTTPLNPSTDKTVNILEAAPTIELADNSINRISINSQVAFNLPTISDHSKYHQILLQLYMETPQTIDLGTTYFSNIEKLDLSKAGHYQIIYEHNGSFWICDVRAIDSTI